MRREKLISALWAFFLSSLLSYSAVMCTVSAFDLGIDRWRLFLWCVSASGLCSLCFTLPLGLVPIGAGAVGFGYLWRSGIWDAGIEAILNRLSRQYTKAYGWKIIRWSFRTADDMEPLILTPLCVAGVVIALLVCWSVCRRKTTIPALLATLVPVGCCFVVTDTVPAIGWLYLTMLVFLVLLFSGSCRARNEKDGNRLTLWLMPIIALSLLLLLIFIPQKGYSGQKNAEKLAKFFHSDPAQLLLGAPNEYSTSGTGSAESVNLRSIGYRTESDSQVLQVTAPFTGTLYLRGRALDVYDGTSWSAGTVDYGTLSWPSEGLETVGEVTVVSRFAHRMLYLPYYSDTMQLLDVSLGMENTKKLTQYSFQCKQPENPAQLSILYPTFDSQAPAEQAEITEAFMQEFPLDKSVYRWSRSVALKVTGPYSSPYHKAQAIASYVRNSASYDTKTSRMPNSSTDFAKWFLEESDTGYCVHFATAAVVLLQAAGIPARYVTGYMVPVKAGEVTPVLSNQSHAWAEYWLPGFGWTVLEATPASSTPSNPSTADTSPSESVGEGNPETPPESTNPSTAPESETSTVVSASESAGIWGMILLTLGSITVLLGGLEGQRKLRLYRRQKLRSRAEPNALALLYWSAMVRYAKLLKELPDEKLLDIALLAKYSRHQVTSAQLNRFAASEAAAISRLKTKNPFLRLYYRWILAIY